MTRDVTCIRCALFTGFNMPSNSERQTGEEALLQLLSRGLDLSDPSDSQDQQHHLVSFDPDPIDEDVMLIMPITIAAPGSMIAGHSDHSIGFNIIMPSCNSNRQTGEDTLRPLTLDLDPARGPQGQQYHPDNFLEPDPIREDCNRPPNAARASMISISGPAHHIESETAIAINDIIDACMKQYWGMARPVEEKTQRLFQFVESLSRRHESLKNMMGIDSTVDTGASMHFEIQAAVQSYSDLVSSIREGMASIEVQMKDQIKRALGQDGLPVSQNSQHLRSVAFHMSVISKVFLLLVSFLNVNSNVDAIRRPEANVEAYLFVQE